MKYYLAHVGLFLNHKNKLEKAIQDFIKSYDRSIILATHIEVAKKAIQNRVDALTKEFPKCTPIKADWWTPAHNKNDEVKDWVLGGVECVRFSFMSSKEVKL